MIKKPIDKYLFNELIKYKKVDKDLFKDLDFAIYRFKIMQPKIYN